MGTGTAPYQNCIVASTVAVAVTAPAEAPNATGGQNGQALALQDVKITKQIDISSPYLAQYATLGQQIASVKIYIQQNDPTHPNQLIAPFEIDLKNAFITSVTQTATDGTSASLVELVTINCENIMWKYVL
jgi:type VI secretion system Hcp family effector